MTLGTFHTIVGELTRRGVPADKAEAVAMTKIPPDEIAALQRQRAKADTRSEKEIERECDKLMQKLGFEVIRFSHPGKTRQTEGIPDRRYYRRPRGYRDNARRFDRGHTLWFECKSATGTQRPGQKLFEELVTACNEHYVCGGIDAVVQWLESQGLGTVRNGNFEPNTF